MKGLQPQLNRSSLLNANEYLGYVFTQVNTFESLLMQNSISTKQRANPMLEIAHSGNKKFAVVEMFYASHLRNAPQ